MAPPYTEQDWLLRRPRITDLYSKQGRTLVEVLEQLRIDGFAVTSA